MLAGLAVAALLGALAAAPAGADAAKLRRGVYDCMTYNFSTGLLDYQQSIKLAGHKRYQQAYDRHGTRMVKPTKGTYKLKGKRVRFRRGALGGFHGRIKKGSRGQSPFFTLYHGRKTSGESCYRVKHP